MEMATRDDQLEMMWVSDMLLPHDPSTLMLDAQTENPFFTDSPHSMDDMRSRVPLLGPCEVANDWQNQDQPSDEMKLCAPQEMEGFMMLDEYDPYCDVTPRFMTTATQTASPSTRKIKPIKHPGLKLKTPIAYQKDTDLSVIPIQRDGMAVCEKCGAIGVKHAFYTRERRFCSLACAREYTEIERGQVSVKQEPEDDLEQEIKQEYRQELSLQYPPMDEPSKDMSSDSSLPPLLNLIPPIPPLLDEPLSPPVKRNRAELANTYEWKSQLSESGFFAAPVTCFRHAPISDIWENITVGMKVEVENTDCDDFDEALPDSFWVATVLRIAGYKALLRYEGFGQNSSKDFWVSLCSSNVHPVGWCATRGKPLIPPKSKAVEEKYKDWKEFLVKRLTGARTLPSNFYNKVNESLSSRFRCGMHLEVVDKNRISRVRLATIENIVGKRLHVMYYNADSDDNGFWCHEDSPLIHPVGWAHRVGHSLAAPRSYVDRCEEGLLYDSDATEEYFLPPKPVNFPLGQEFKEGMKLEAVDPLNLSSICVATVMKVLRENYLMIRIDSYDADASGADWFCYHASSPCIFPSGFCQQNSITLTPPKDYDQAEFVWHLYLEMTASLPAPPAVFSREIPPHGFSVGMRLEAADLMDPRLVCVGTVSRVVGRLLKVHFDGWEEEYDQWLDCESPDVYPVGWCHLVGHKLEGPRTPVKGMVALGKSPKGVKKKPRRRHKKPGKGSPGAVTSKKSLAGLMAAAATATTTTAAMTNAVKPGPASTKASSSEQRPTREPAQATKLMADYHGGEGVPEAPAPEMGQEPAGPDQSLPVATEPSQPPIPRGRTATSYINTTAASTKLIPRLVDSTGNSSNFEPGELVPAEWNVFDVAQFLRVNDCAAYCDSFSRKKIDGVKLLSLTNDHIVDLTGMKVGPSVKIHDLIQQLRNKLDSAYARKKDTGLMKLGQK